MRTAVLLTCHNRAAVTGACLRALSPQLQASDSVYLVDDGSTDGTANLAKTIVPNIKIIHGDGSLYWAGGMRLAMRTALEQDFDYYLWLNDDTVLSPDAIEQLHRLHPGSEHPVILVGSTKDPDSETFSYGAWKEAPGLLRGLTRSWKPVPPHATEVTRADTMNGNCVLISRAVVQRVGGIDPSFVHSMADLDYGLRARGLGCSILVAPGYLGTCRANDLKPPRTLIERWRQTTGPKGHPFRAHVVFCARHKGIFWPAAWVAPYAAALAAPLHEAISRKR